MPRLFGEDSIDFEVRPIDEVSVIDGPVASAEVFFDLNGDGEVTDAEKDAQRDDSGRSRYLTGEDGTVDIPSNMSVAPLLLMWGVLMTPPLANVWKVSSARLMKAGRDSDSDY